MKRALFVALSGLLATAAAGCAKKEAPAPPPPDVKVATVLQKDVPIYVEAIGQTRGSTEIEVRARVEGFIQTRRLQGGQPGQEGPAALHDRPAPVPGRRSPRPRARSPRPRRSSPARSRTSSRYEPLVAKNAISRQEYETAVVVAARGGGRASRPPRRRSSSAEIDLGYTRVDGARGRPRGQDRGLPGHAGGPRAEHAAHAHLADRPRSTCASRSPSGTTSYYARRAQERGGTAAGSAALPFELVLPTARCIPKRAGSCSSTATSTRRPARS